MRRDKLIVLMLGISLGSLSGCGGADGGSGGDGGADFLNLSINGGAELAHVETASADAPFGFDPWIEAHYNFILVPPGTVIEFFQGYDLATDFFDQGLLMIFLGNATGTFNLEPLQFEVLFGTSSGLFGLDDGTFSNGQIDVTQYGAVGGKVGGTFNFTICNVFAPDCSNFADRLTATGSFDVTRIADFTGGSGLSG